MQERTITITLKVAYGSEFQEDFGGKMLKTLMDAWRLQLTSMHSKNSCQYTIDYGDGVKVNKIIGRD